MQVRSEEFCQLTAVLCDIIHKAYPQLPFSSLQININTRAALHTDKANIGMSAAVAVGRFSG